MTQSAAPISPSYFPEGESSLLLVIKSLIKSTPHRSQGWVWEGLSLGKPYLGQKEIFRVHTSEIINVKVTRFELLNFFKRWRVRISMFRRVGDWVVNDSSIRMLESPGGYLMFVVVQKCFKDWIAAIESTIKSAFYQAGFSCSMPWQEFSQVHLLKLSNESRVKVVRLDCSHPK